MIPDKLNEVARQIHEDGFRPQETVRNLLTWFNQKRRGDYVVATIRQALNDAGLATEPDFESVYIDAIVTFVPSETKTNEIEASTTTTQNNRTEAFPTENVSASLADPTFRIGQLQSANTPLITVNPNASLTEATTLMMMHDFSQLPVMQDERNLKGVVSWASIGRRFALRRSCENVRDCMEADVPEVSAKSSLFAAIDLIVESGYVLVRQDDRKYSGVVTTSDLSLEFRLLAEPFLLIREIENHIRRLIDRTFKIEELISIIKSTDERLIETVDNLTFGQYLQVLGDRNHWVNFNLAIDRSAFVERLDRVRRLRNEVTHFRPDPLTDEEVHMPRTFVIFMRGLVA